MECNARIIENTKYDRIMIKPIKYDVFSLKFIPLDPQLTNVFVRFFSLNFALNKKPNPIAAMETASSPKSPKFGSQRTAHAPRIAGPIKNMSWYFASRSNTAISPN